MQPSKAAAALEWLAHHGQHITCLSLHTLQPLRSLPCPNLQDLYLDVDSVQLGPVAAAGGAPGVLQSCTALTSLAVQCMVAEDPEGVMLDCFSGLTGLQDLYVWPKKILIDGLSAATLPRLRNLRSLSFDGLSLANLGQLAALSNLQHLALSCAIDVALGPSSVPALAFPAALTTLQLWSPVEAGLFSLIPTGLMSLQIVYPVVGPADLFLSGISRLQQLTELHLNPFSPLDWPPAGPAYSALTASSSLVSLLLEGRSMLGACLPDGVWPFVFPTAHNLPHLTQLSFKDPDADVPTDPAFRGPSWGQADVASLVRCCPNLRLIRAMHFMHGQHVAELHKLSALRGLSVVYGPGTVEEGEGSLRHLAEVSQLRSLAVTLDSAGVSAAALLPLTRLTALTELEVCQPAEPEDGGAGADVIVEFTNTQVRTCLVSARDSVVLLGLGGRHCMW